MISREILKKGRVELGGIGYRSWETKNGTKIPQNIYTGKLDDNTADLLMRKNNPIFRQVIPGVTGKSGGTIS